MSELYPGSQQVAPMRYANTPSQDKVDAAMASLDWCAQPKYDGAFYQLEHTDEGDIYLFGRTLSKVTGEYTEKIANVPWLKQWAEQLPKGTTLIGEIYIPGGHSNTVTSIMGCLPEKAIKRQEKVHVQYMVFDCIRYAGEDLVEKSFLERQEYLTYWLLDLFIQTNNLDGYRWEDPHVKLVPTYGLSESWYDPAINIEWGKLDSFAPILSSIFAQGGEGMVFKHKDAPYRPGKRTTTSQAFKIKEHIDSLDFVCMDLLDPVKEYTGKDVENWPYWKDNEPVTKPYYYGWKNAVQIGAYQNGELVPVGTVASGLTDELREDLAMHPDSYIGSVVEVSCMSVNKQDHTVRHPVLVQFRSDKPATDCIMEEIFA